ncbi:hypothetical protein [Actibacterium pelagium]|uniref:DUF302 domain-containing protein n=1 Tax=Actibacterium pelagium TaxID=2029103 RepID=A0A917AA59_9RHOB|nr:hypothetical protein [Actibacterium pelagium]GGE37450.1 hypothetical protein GCM10011517_01500 [Actibacterium pelagium]
MKQTIKKAQKLLLPLWLILAASTAFAQQLGGGGMHGHGADGTGHDMRNMPGLQGENVTKGETADLATMFQTFPQIDREVTNLPNGIRAVTRSDNPQVKDAIVRHVIDMIARVEAGDDPKVFIQSPTLDIFFERYEALTTQVEVTEDGVIVTQTSDDPELVEAMHIHAAEVSAMADQGMRAVHQMMMERAQNAQ